MHIKDDSDFHPQKLANTFQEVRKRNLAKFILLLVLLYVRECIMRGIMYYIIKTESNFQRDFLSHRFRG